MVNESYQSLDFEKGGGLIPVIVIDEEDSQVLMQAYMNKEALDKTIESKKVTFFSRTKNRLWTKGEESGHFLNLKKIVADCDYDSLLIIANPIGPTCHKNLKSCFHNEVWRWEDGSLK